MQSQLKHFFKKNFLYLFVEIQPKKRSPYKGRL